MPIGYVFSVALLAFCAATAMIGPRPAHTTQSYWGFWVTFLINELPLFALYALAGDSILAFVQGDLASPGGLVAFAVAVLTAAGLAVLVRRALPTGAVLRRAFADDAGIDLAVRQGDGARHIGPAAVVVAALIAGLAAWGLLALLERTIRRPVPTYRVIASIVLILSLAAPLGSGVDTSSRLVLLGMHLTVATALIVGLPGRRNCR